MRFDEHFFKGALSSVSIEGKALPNDIRFLADSKKIQPGDFFIVLAEHDKKCIDEAIARGAKGFFIADKQKEVKKQLLKQGVTVVAVPDTRVALLKLATAWRSQFTCPVIGITGSVGKTSTKEILANILCTEEVSYFSSDNDARNEIDMASNVLRMRSDHKVALFEMGVSRRGQMAELAAIVRPTYAVITNVGHSNMEGLGSLADIALEQRDIFKFFTQESIGVINGDLPVLGSIGYVHPVIKFGSKTANQVQARKINVDDTCINFVLKMYKQKYHIELKNTHSGEVFNSLAAVSIAYLLKIPTEIIVKGIQVPIVISGRFERRIMTAGKGVLINDAS
ncbi:UDP-N-acetylmuramoyl-tripeptide--D-alanyl-D-alanine ligase, partial [Candidatus Dependentiae bacterium]|nr:UDP-N-acetylmuramoyl-tripeptide--D-alanyl-D-alanine ligase [Candidatus Dependentiae bacterium]